MNKLQKYIEKHLDKTSKSDCFIVGTAVGFVICVLTGLNYYSIKKEQCNEYNAEI